MGDLVAFVAMLDEVPARSLRNAEAGGYDVIDNRLVSGTSLKDARRLRTRLRNALDKGTQDSQQYNWLPRP